MFLYEKLLKRVKYLLMVFKSFVTIIAGTISKSESFCFTIINLSVVTI
jgi:hypothetical protein